MSNLASILDYGASTSSPDNTAAIQAALNGSGEIYIPAGSYNTGPLVAPASLLKLWGPGTLVGLVSVALAWRVTDHREQRELTGELA